MNTNVPSLVAALALLLLGGCATTSDNFSVADRDSDGKLSKSEFKKALVTAIYANGDPDGDGKISFAEYSAVDPNYPKARFRSRDLNRDGFVTPEELDRYAESTGSFDKLVADIDSNGDGFIDREESKVFNQRLMAAKGDNALQKLYHLNASIQG